MDIDQIRNPQILAYGLSKVDDTYTIYYDETNNVRALYIRDTGLNVSELKVFVLGGVVHPGHVKELDIQILRNALFVQKTAPEIKFQHIAKGSMKGVLESQKLGTTLNWIKDSDLLIHYHQLDPFYWSIADIIDSLIYEWPDLYQYHALLKADLVTLLRKDIPATLRIFKQYNYPSLQPEDRKPFLNSLTEMIDSHEFGAMLLKGLLEKASNHSSLEFIEGFEPGQLIENFSLYYVNRIALFKHSQHILDEESKIQALLLENPLTSQGQPVSNYRFADSVQEPGIQVSDIIVGLLGKIHTFLTENDVEEVLQLRKSLSVGGMKNIQLLNELLSKSEQENPAFIHHVGSLHDLHKLRIFLEG